jgi:hypothetical protein
VAKKVRRFGGRVLGKKKVGIEELKWRRKGDSLKIGLAAELRK